MTLAVGNNCSVRQIGISEVQKTSWCLEDENEAMACLIVLFPALACVILIEKLNVSPKVPTPVSGNVE